MRVGIDTDFLVCLSIKEHPRHSKALELWEELGEKKAHWVLLPQVITEFLHVITDARRFERPPTMPAALSIVEQWLSWVDFCPSSFSTPAYFIKEMRTHNLGRKRVLDTSFACSLLDMGISQIATGNGKDYRCFKALQIHEF